MRKILLSSNLHKKSFNKIRHTRNLNNFLNNNLSSYSTFQNYPKKENNNFLNLTNINKITNYNTNNSYYKYESPYISNFSSYMNLNGKYNNRKINNINNNISTNLSINSYKNNQTYNEDINLMTMKLNFKILEQKLSNLSNIVMPNPTLTSSNNLLNKRYNANESIHNNNRRYNTFNNNPENVNQKYNYLQNKKYNNFLKKQSIKKKFLNDKLLIDDDNKFINEVNLNNFDKEINIYKLNQNDEKKESRNPLNDLEFKFETDLNHLNKKESDSITDDDLSDLADEIYKAIYSKKMSSKKANNNDNNSNNKLINEKNINNHPNNNFDTIKTDVESSNNISKNLNITDFVIYKTNFTINNNKSQKKLKQERPDLKRQKEINKQISNMLLEKENKNINKNQEIKIPEIFEHFNQDKNEKVFLNEAEHDIDLNNDIKIPIDSQDELKTNIKEKYLKNNKKSDSKNIEKKKENNIIGKNSNNNSNSKNKNINKIFKEKKEFKNYYLENKKSISKNNVSFENDLIYISYNDKDKPTKINLYKVKNKNETGIKIKYTPKNLDNYINILLNKQLKSILLIFLKFILDKNLSP